VQLTHVEDTIKTADGICYSEHANRECDTGIFPTGVCVQGHEDVLGCTALRKRAECRNDSNEEDNVENATDRFQIVDDLSQVEVENQRNNEEGDQKHRRVPGLWFVAWAVEDDQAG